MSYDSEGVSKHATVLLLHQARGRGCASFSRVLASAVALSALCIVYADLSVCSNIQYCICIIECDEYETRSQNIRIGTSLLDCELYFN